MPEEKVLTQEEMELKAAYDGILQSTARKKLIIAGPGTGKTTLFKEVLKRMSGNPDNRIVLTFINNLQIDLEKDLAGLSKVQTLHSYCLGLLYLDASLRKDLTRNFICCPGLASLISKDWEIINRCESPKFVNEMRGLVEENNLSFYLERGDFYDAVDFDDVVYRTYDGFTTRGCQPGKYELVLIDEYQDFNRLEAGIVDILGDANPILIAGDDDQALYSQLRDASWEYIRSLKTRGDFEVHELPFCMRCPKVIVDAINEIIEKARTLHKLLGRISKPFKHFPLVKGEDSVKYPKISFVETTVQSKKINYMGRFIAQEISSIPHDEFESAVQGGYPSVLVIVAKPYRDQIIEHLLSIGFEVETREKVENSINREFALSLLKQNQESNLGWRIILEIDNPSYMTDIIQLTKTCDKPLAQIIPTEYKNQIIEEVQVYIPVENSDEVKESDKNTETEKLPIIRVTSFEGSKGMSALHVFIVGLHEGEIPHDKNDIKDIEICKFIVGLSRTRKKCTILNTRYFSEVWKKPSIFISWINSINIDRLFINKQYWEKQ